MDNAIFIWVISVLYAIVALAYISHKKYFSVSSSYSFSDRHIPAVFLLIAFGVYFGCQLFIGIFVLFLNHLAIKYFLECLPTEMGPWVYVTNFILVAVLLYQLTHHISEPLRHRFWGNQSLFNQLKKLMLYAVCCVMIYPALAIIMAILQEALDLFLSWPQQDQFAITYLRTLKDKPVLFWCMSISIVGLVPFVEEILFRGFLQGFLVDKLGLRLGVWLTALIFASSHLAVEQGATNIEIMIVLTILSVLFSRAYLRTGTLSASIGMHAAFNGINILLLNFFE